MQQEEAPIGWQYHESASTRAVDYDIFLNIDNALAIA